MSAPFPASLVALAVFLLGCASCARESADFTLDIGTLRQLNPENTTAIDYREGDGVVLVTVVDKYGDAHIHRLIEGDLSRSQAIDLLKLKQAELAQRKR